VVVSGKKGLGPERSAAGPVTEENSRKAATRNSFLCLRLLHEEKIVDALVRRLNHSLEGIKYSSEDPITAVTMTGQVLICR